ncbi:hypothetical protein [Bacillus altitudinis]|uniref:hypothetical protein n=1 Tax=Bacillus altitudinis TaxID=293387 RepID=UPI0031F67856
MSLKTYIYHLSGGVKMINEINETQEDTVFTFLTSYGQIEGEISELDYFEVKPDSKEEVFQEELERMVKGNKLNAYNLTEYTYERLHDEEQHFAIYLKNVKVRQGINEIQLNTFVLLTNQIIGIIPGKLKK